MTLNHDSDSFDARAYQFHHGYESSYETGYKLGQMHRRINHHPSNDARTFWGPGSQEYAAYTNGYQDGFDGKPYPCQR